MSLDPTRILAPASRWLLYWSPLAALPLMLNLRWKATVAPNEEPKWAVLLVLGLVMGLAALAGNASSTGEDRTAPGRAGWSLTGIALCLFLLGLAIGAVHAVNIAEAWNRLAYWCAAGMAWWASVRAARSGAEYPRHLQLALVLAGLVFAGEFWRSYRFDHSLPGYNISLWFSPVGHVNFTADVLVVLIPLLAWVTVSASHWAVVAGAGLALSGSLVMLLSGASRGGIGGLLAGAVVMALVAGLGRKLRWADLPWARLALLAACVASAFVVQGQMSYKFRDMARLSASLTGGLQENREKFHLDPAASLQEPLPPLAALWQRAAPWLGTRAPMWASTAGMIADAPWGGHGTGNFLFIYPKYGNHYPSFRDPLSREHSATTNPHNVLLQIAAENGVPMSVLFAGLYGCLLWRLVRAAWQEPRPLWWCGLWAAGAVAFDAQFNHVFFNPASLYLCALGLGAVYGSLPASAAVVVPVSNAARLAPLEAGMLGIVLLWFVAAPLNWLVSEYEVAAAQRLEAEKPPAAEVQLGYEKALPWSPSNFRALYGAAVAAFQAGHVEQSESLVRRFLSVFPHHMNGLNLYGAILMRSGRLEEAEQAFRQALAVFPDAGMVRQNLMRVEKMRSRP